MGQPYNGHAASRNDTLRSLDGFSPPDSSSTEALGSAARALSAAGAGRSSTFKNGAATTCVRSPCTLGVRAGAQPHLHAGRLQSCRTECVHVDSYRVRSAAEVDELGLRMTGAGNLLLIEWPEMGGVAVPQRT